MFTKKNNTKSITHRYSKIMFQFFLCINFISSIAFAQSNGTICIVGKNCYATISEAISAASNGDVIEIPAGDYKNVSATLSASNVTVRGIGGRPRLDGGGKSSNGKGHFYVTGSNNTFDNLELFNEVQGLGVENAWNQGAIFFSAYPKQGVNLTLINMYIHDNGQGIFTEGNVGTIDIRNSEFARNGEGGGHSHNLYINHNVAKLIMRGVWSHECNGGHILKSRAWESDVQGCMFTDTKSTSLNWFLDFPNGGNITFAGNIVQPGSNSQLMFAYGEDPNPINPGNTVNIYQNTFVSAGATFFQFKNGGKPTYVGNIYCGSRSPVNGDNRKVISSSFVNTDVYNYQLVSPISGSPSLAEFYYIHPANYAARKDSLYGACPISDVHTSIEKENLNNSFSLEQNYPNPFNPYTTIRFSLPKSSLTKIEVFNLLGQRVSQLTDKERSAGNHEIEFNGSNYSSGIYYYKITAGNYTETKKMLLMK